MLKNSSTQFKVFPGWHLKELYQYLDPTLENANFSNTVIYVRTNDINYRDSYKSLQVLEDVAHFE